MFNLQFVETVSFDGEVTTKAVEEAANIYLNVPYEPTDIHSALDRVYGRRREQVGDHRIVTYKSFTGLPPILQINVSRVAAFGNTTVKMDHALRLDETLYMDRYCDLPKILPVREESWAIRKKLRSLKVQRDAITNTPMDGPGLLERSVEYFAQVEEANEVLEGLKMANNALPIDLTTELAQEAKALREQLDPLDEQIRELEQTLEKQFATCKQQKYRLYAVFFHRGKFGGSGHYLVHIRDFKSQIWRSYNDRDVTVHENLDDIVNAQDPERDGVPSYVVYVRDEVKEEYVEPLCRAPEGETVETTGEDTQMNDSSSTNGYEPLPLDDDAIPDAVGG